MKDSRRTLMVVGMVIAIFAISLGVSLWTMKQMIAKMPASLRQASEVDPQLQVAEETARNTLGDFLTKLKSGAVQGAIKVRFTSPKGPEYIWVDHIQQLGKGQFTGTLADAPRLLANKVKGDTVSFGQKDVVDWIAKYPNGDQDGDFTGEVLRREGQ